MNKELIKKTCINCKHAGVQFYSAYDGRWLIKCNIQEGSNRPHESCDKWDYFKGANEQ